MADTTKHAMADRNANELRDGLRARLGAADDATDADLLSALDARLADLAVGPTEPVKLAERTIQHALFSYDLPGGGNAVAFRGQTVSLMPHDVERGEKYDAFTKRVGDEPDSPSASSLPLLAVDASDADADAWVVSGSVSDILAAVTERPETAGKVIEAEQRRGESARKTLLEGLAKLSGEA